MSHRSSTVFQGNDPDELAAALSTPRSPIIVEPLGGGPLAFRGEFFTAGPMTFGDCAYQGDIRCQRLAASGRLLVFLPIEGDALFDNGRDELHSAPGHATIVDGTRNARGELYGSRRHLTTFIDNDRLTALLAAMIERPVEGSLEFTPRLDVDTGAGQMLTQLVETACRGLRGDAPLRRAPLALSALGDAVAHLLLEAVPHRYSDELGRPAALPAPRHVKWAIEFMHAHLGDPITIADVAAAARVSVRTLQQGFRQFRATTPMAYLQELRLAAAHRELTSAPATTTVADVAFRWGFGHLGRFAADYKKRFGQTPSQTLRKWR
ncbi:helix-turn-helix transcriptional regulator [Sinorhizobium saheli]|uniref:AraC family transcriptional regulator n=1 Tax=Sinorhizobium saheli TaxID=36856 RepID=A0A178Y8J5_SINSA|nr:AraC family transcriptional regulator [Sinorhizobium saheli]MQW90479.1 helix-turn-helix domain-containing protein [Sinorhizobium saheli]OAP43840.1 AraC family transcriptional regulator [Sinorhizobium saheli]